MRLLPLFLLLAACDDYALVDDKSEATSVEQGECPDSALVDAAVEASFSEIYAGPLAGSPDVQGGWAEVVTSEGRLQEILGSEDFNIEAVDFDTTAVLVGSVFVSSTCSLSLDGYSVVMLEDGRALLDVRATDGSGACETVCDAEGHVGVLVGVDLAQEATVCTRRTDECF